MAEGRRRVHERFGVELEPEVQVLGEVELAGGLGAVRRPAWRRAAVVVVVVAAVYWFVFARRRRSTPHARPAAGRA